MLHAMLEHGVDKITFASSCATYGEPESIPINENQPQQPINPYGLSKLMMEKILDNLARSNGLKSVCLRYFNAALGRLKNQTVFCKDYPTKDGTCIRDYIHVSDLAQAHYLALLYLLDGGKSNKYNLGNESGYSILDVISTASQVSEKDIAYTFAERRAGDPGVLVGSAEHAIRELHWKAEFNSLEKINQTAWGWHTNNPKGYATTKVS
ncbi:MAG: UDP-glucose 4-epimerase [Desulforhopalus sp.]|jgi:UDP-glucose 4-epimerase